MGPSHGGLFVEARSEQCQHALRSANGSSRHLQVYLWLTTAGTDQGLELEFVFWNDMTFPKENSEARNEEALSRLLTLAQACRSHSPGAKCILAGEHNGDPRELLENEWAVVW